MRKQSNKKGVVRVAAGFATILVLSMGAFSYFTNYQTKQLAARAGTLTTTITGETEDLTNGLTILNPGDANPLCFTVNNTGSKSADIKAVMTVKSELPLTENAHEYKITDKSGTELSGVLSEDKTVLVYTVDDVVLQGSVECGESDGNISSCQYDYRFVMDKNAKNIWQGSEVEVKIETFAKQHRNTSSLGNDWTEIVEK